MARRAEARERAGRDKEAAVAALRPQSPVNVSLRDAVAAPDTKRDYTRWVFATIADRYDLINVLLSFNRDRAWKRRLAAQADCGSRDVALDAACGTGDITFALARGGGRAVGLDITPRMIDLARRKAAGRTAVGPPPGTHDRHHPTFVVGDLMALPFDAATFDLVTTGYGIRNVPDISAAIAEIARVLKPGGRFFSLDFDRPSNPLIRAAYLGYLTVVGAAIGWAVHGNANTYRYIPETIRSYPGAAGVVSLLRAAGFEEASYEPVFGGFMALHRGVKAR